LAFGERSPRSFPAEKILLNMLSTRFPFFVLQLLKELGQFRGICGGDIGTEEGGPAAGRAFSADVRN
jgi:hypothetical protein